VSENAGIPMDTDGYLQNVSSYVKFNRENMEKTYEKLMMHG
jgi:hypothetical protein